MMAVWSRLVSSKLALAVALVSGGLVQLWDSPALAAINSPANTYVNQSLYNGNVMRWHDSTRVIYVTFEPGSAAPGWTPEYDAIAKEGFQAWETALGGRIHFEYTADPKLTDITVRWRAASNGHEIGNQQIAISNGSQVFSNADINLALTAPGGRRFVKAEIKATAAHEMGHALGIKGHSPSPNDMMFASANPADARKQPAQIALTSRDIATMRALYAQPANITNPPDIHLHGFRQFDYYLRLGRNAYNQNDYARALDYFKSAQQAFPKDKTVHLYTGLCAYNTKNYPDAIFEFLDHMALGGPGQASARIYIGAALQALAVDDINAKRHPKGEHKLKLALRYCRWGNRMGDIEADDRDNSAKIVEAIQTQLQVLGIRPQQGASSV